MDICPKLSELSELKFNLLCLNCLCLLTRFFKTSTSYESWKSIGILYELLKIVFALFIQSAGISIIFFVSIKAAPKSGPI